MTREPDKQTPDDSDTVEHGGQVVPFNTVAFLLFIQLPLAMLNYLGIFNKNSLDAAIQQLSHLRDVCENR